MLDELALMDQFCVRGNQIAMNLSFLFFDRCTRHFIFGGDSVVFFGRNLRRVRWFFKRTQLVSVTFLRLVLYL